MSAATETPGFETAATVVHRLAVLLDAGIAPLSAWQHAAAGSDSTVARDVAAAAGRGAVGRELVDQLASAGASAPAGEREAWSALAALARSST